MRDQVLYRIPPRFHSRVKEIAAALGFSLNAFTTAAIVALMLQRTPGASILAETAPCDDILLGIAPSSDWSSLNAALEVLRDAEIVADFQSVEHPGKNAVAWAARFTTKGLRAWEGIIRPTLSFNVPQKRACA